MSIIDLLSKNEAKRRKAVEDILKKAGKITDTVSPFVKGAVTYAPGSQAMRDTIQNLTDVMLANKVKRVEAPSYTTDQLKAMGNSTNFNNQAGVKNFQSNLANSNNAYKKLQSELENPTANANFNKVFGVSAEEQARQSGAQLYGMTKNNQRGQFISPTASRNYIGGAATALAPLAMAGMAGVGGGLGILSRLAIGAAGGAGETFGTSTPSNAVQSTLLGAGAGLLGTFAGELVSNPALRKQIKKANTGKYSGELNLGDNNPIVNKNTGETLDDAVKKLKGYGWDEKDIQGYKDAVLGNTPKTAPVDKNTMTNLNPTGSIVTEYTPNKRMAMKLGENITTLDKTAGKSADDMITIYRGAPNSQKKINPGDYITTNYELAKSYTGDGNILEQRVKMSDILDDITEPLGEEYIYRPNKSVAVKPSAIDPLIGKDGIIYDLGFDGNSETIDMYPTSNMREDKFKPVGQIHFSVDESAGTGTIDDIYVDSVYQRKGLATNALKKLKTEYPDIKFTTTLQTDKGSALFNSPEVHKILGTKTEVVSNPLIEEAKKYKTPEEFVKGRGKRQIDKFMNLPESVQNDIASEILDSTKPQFELQARFGADDLKSGLGDANISIGSEPVDDLIKQFPIQNRSTSKANVDKLKVILSEQGYLDPVIVNGRELVDGGHRIAAYQQSGYKDIPVIDISNIYNEIKSSPSKILDPYEWGLTKSTPLKSQLSDIWNQAHSTEQVNKDAMKSADKIGDYIFEGRPGNDLYKQQMEILLNKNAKTPKLKGGISYPKQGRLASRSKTAKRIPLTSWDDAMKEALLKGRVRIASGKK